MFCSRCGHENADDVRFCAECGVPQQEDGEGLGSYRPFDDDAESGGVPAPSDIAPRDLGALISESISTYRNVFLTLFLIALVPQVPSVLSAVLAGEPADDSVAATFDPTSIVLGLVAFLIGIPSTAAGVFCAARALTGRKADIVTSYSSAFGVLVPAAVATIIVTIALIASGILWLILIGIPLFFYLLVIWFFAVPAVVIEGRDGIDALKRSRELTRGSWWRLFGIGTVFTLLIIAVAIPVGIVFAVIAAAADNDLVLTIGVALIGALLTPVYYAGSVLVYVDLRVRNEGYGTQALADDLARRPGRMAP